MDNKRRHINGDSMLQKESVTKSLSKGTVTVPTFNPGNYQISSTGQLTVKPSNTDTPKRR